MDDQVFKEVGFSAAYNLLQDEEEYKKLLPFLKKLVEKGGIFVRKNNQGQLDSIVNQLTPDDFSGKLYSRSMGILVLENKVIKKILEQFTDKFEEDDQFKEKLLRWYDVYQTLEHLWITMEFASEDSDLGIKISYWTYLPDFLWNFFPGDPQERGGENVKALTESQASDLTVKYLFDSVDNLFSAYMFHLGKFQYNPEQLRKSAFIFHAAIHGEYQDNILEELASNESNALAILIRDALLSAKGSTNLTKQIVDDDILVVSSSGFVGQTGQPTNLNEPSLYLLIFKSKPGNANLLDRLISTIALSENTFQRFNNSFNANILALSNEINTQRQKSSKLKNNLSILPLTMASNVSNQEKIASFSKFTLTARELVEVGSRHLQLRQYYSEIFSSYFTYLDITDREFSRHKFKNIEEGRNFSQLFSVRMDPLQESLYSLKDILNVCSHEVDKLIQDGQRIQNMTIDSLYREDLAKEDEETRKIERDFCFVLMPFRPNFDEIYEEIIRPLFQEPDLNLDCIRADEIYGTQAIIKDIWLYIRNAAVVIAELTDKNPNVLYELGLCHVLKKPVILIVQDMEDVPFDLKHLRVIVYSTLPKGLKVFQTQLKNTINEILKKKETIDVLPW